LKFDLVDICKDLYPFWLRFDIAKLETLMEWVKTLGMEGYSTLLASIGRFFTAFRAASATEVSPITHVTTTLHPRSFRC
jgi:hypothetical protein